MSWLPPFSRAGTRSGSVAISARSRSFDLPSSSGEGAVPNIPGWVMPVKLTPGMCRELAFCPLKSQITS
jgi:hypothetical protein